MVLHYLKNEKGIHTKYYIWKLYTQEIIRLETCLELVKNLTIQNRYNLQNVLSQSKKKKSRLRIYNLMM